LLGFFVGGGGDLYTSGLYTIFRSWMGEFRSCLTRGVLCVCLIGRR